MQGRLRPYTRNPHPLMDWYCGASTCTRTARQPIPAPPCPLHPNVRMKRGKKPKGRG